MRKIYEEQLTIFAFALAYLGWRTLALTDARQSVTFPPTGALENAVQASCTKEPT